MDNIRRFCLNVGERVEALVGGDSNPPEYYGYSMAPDHQVE